MDLDALLNPRITDRESLLEFSEALADQLPAIERCIADLRKTPDDPALIATLFRGMHTIKGDAAMCKVSVGVMITHPIESVLSRVRDGEMPFSDLLAELSLLALDRLELVVESLGDGRRTDALKLPELVGGMELLAKVAKEQTDAQAAKIIESVTGFRPTAASRLNASTLTLGVSRDISGDLKFFHQLAAQFETRSPLFVGRTERLVRLALDTNIVAGSPIDRDQLEAAVCLHDFGMMCLPESVWLKVGKLSDADMVQMHQHPRFGAGLLERMNGWEAAAEIVRQHHEMPDGRGYPERLTGERICAGAKIIAIIDAFESVTLKQSHRGQSRSLLRAIAEINACDNQFDPVWIAHFNTVIRQTLET